MDAFTSVPNRLTIFSIPKPFEGHIGLIQQNALASWTRLQPRPEIILLGRDQGVAEAAKAFGAVYVPDIATNEYGTPLVSDAISRVCRECRGEFVMFSNADILFDHSLLAGIEAVHGIPRFLLCGQRWDLDVTSSYSAANDLGWEQLFAEARTRGRLHGPAGMDYFVFRATQNFALPSFAVGRVGWDSWLVWKARRDGVPVIDATAAISAVHQNHDYASLKLGYQHQRGPERDLNLRAAGGLSRLLTLREASHILIDGQVVRPPWPNRLCAMLGPTWPYQKMLALKRMLS